MHSKRKQFIRMKTTHSIRRFSIFAHIAEQNPVFWFPSLNRTTCYFHVLRLTTKAIENQLTQLFRQRSRLFANLATFNHNQFIWRPGRIIILPGSESQTASSYLSLMQLAPRKKNKLNPHKLGLPGKRTADASASTEGQLVCLDKGVKVRESSGSLSLAIVKDHSCNVYSVINHLREQLSDALIEALRRLIIIMIEDPAIRPELLTWRENNGNSANKKCALNEREFLCDNRALKVPAASSFLIFMPRMLQSDKIWQ